ncbi:MAG: glycerol-3-phosphate dehydrogenase C-terminal domain-containing protein, partial [Candidatus Nanopelagicales bacterium]
AGPSVTARLPLVGAQPWGITVAGIPRRLIERYGSEAARVMAYATDEPDLLDPVAPGVPTLGVEVVHAVRCEGALDVDDVMQRRTRLSLVAEDADRARPRVTHIVESTR